MDFTLHTFYLICATVGGSLLVIQLVLMLLGFGDEGDLADSEFELDEAGVGGNLFFGYMSFKAVVAFLTFFGLTGLLVEKSRWSSTWISPVVAVAAGIVAFYIAGLIMSFLYRLQTHGNVDVKNAVGETAQVYLKIPAQNSGAGKVTVSLQQRTMELPAITQGEEILTGSLVKVVGVSGESILEVTPLS